MSCTEITLFNKEGIAIETIDIKNAFRGAMAIWQILEKKYLPEYIPNWAKDYPKSYIDENFGTFTRTSGLDKKALKEIWDIPKGENVSRIDKIVMYSTYDHILCKRENFAELIEAFEKFEGVTSLKEQAEAIRNLPDDITAVGWNQTNVCKNTWINYEYDEEKDEHRSYNYNKDDEHYFIFDEV